MLDSVSCRTNLRYISNENWYHNKARRGKLFAGHPEDVYKNVIVIQNTTLSLFYPSPENNRWRTSKNLRLQTNVGRWSVFAHIEMKWEPFWVEVLYIEIFITPLTFWKVIFIPESGFSFFHSAVIDTERVEKSFDFVLMLSRGSKILWPILEAGVLWKISFLRDLCVWRGLKPIFVHTQSL